MLASLTMSAFLTAALPAPAAAPQTLGDGASRIAVLVLDLQKDFLADDGKMVITRDRISGLLATNNAVVTGARSKGALVVYIGNEFSPSDWLPNLFRRGAAVKGTPGTALDPRLSIVSPHYFPKQQGNAFSNPDLEPFLRAQGITNLVVTGVYADGCVKETVEGALRQRFQVTVLSDAVASGSLDRTKRALSDMKRAGAEIRGSHDWLAQPQP